jgi:valyl-tRNA synthetase
MDKTYNPAHIEAKIYQDWETNNYFLPQGDGPAYCIMLPPPNVTGSLHMGHAFQHTLMDILIRYHRMKYDKTLWQCGTDHAGIATQMVVERQLEQENISRHMLGRVKFIERVWDWKQQSGTIITQQLRRLGASMDWSRERFTMDEGLSRSVQKVFIDLYNENLIYRGKRLVNWDPVLHTAISDLEVISEEEDGNLWHIRYPRVEGNGYLVVATTRPETMLGDAAIAVHPDDERYRDLIGKEVELPLTGRRIPVIADDYVDPEFGTGCVKITPAHDFNDYEVWLRHLHQTPQIQMMPNEGLINIFTIDANINEIGPAAYQGMDRYKARNQIVTDLESMGLMEKTEPYKLMVPRGDRSHAVIEPYLTDQWYVKVKPLAEPAINAVKNGAIKFIPDNWCKTYFEWMNNIEDWCISRQLWWGHQIPAWYDDNGNIYVGESESEIREREHLPDDLHLVQDEDVLDTWFSSALWPFSTLGWPEQTDDLKTFYPTNVLVTGFDIIFFWVARMIMMGLKFMDDVPFHEVYITGLIRDEHGQKMSKSKGNILDPIDLIDGIKLDDLLAKRTTGLMQPSLAKKITRATRKQFPAGIQMYGTDALRFTFASLASNTRDINFDIGRIGGYRNFCNKIWNAARYVIMNVDNRKFENINSNIEPDVYARWINTRLEQVIGQVTRHIHTYRFDLASKVMYEFIWDEYCDWYLELSKITLNDPDITEKEKYGTLFTLVNVMEIFLKLLHPFMPFITEEIWKRISTIMDMNGNSIMKQFYPNVSNYEPDDSVLLEMNWVKEFILNIRRTRSERNIPPDKYLPVCFKDGSNEENNWLQKHKKYIIALGKIESLSKVDSAPADTTVCVSGAMTVFVSLADLIEPRIELDRLTKEINKLQSDQLRIRKKLENSDFINRAPQEIVTREKDRLVETSIALEKLKEQYQQIEKNSKLNV